MNEFQLGWKLGTVGDCCTEAFTGKSPKYSKTKTKYRIIGQQANQRYGIDLRYVKYGTTEFGDAQEDCFFLRYNDVILNTLGTGSIGRSGIYKRREPILTDGHPFVFRTSEICLPDFLFYYLRYSEKQIIDSASGSTNQRFLKLKSFLLFPIPIPPIDEQKRIVARIEELFSQLDAGVETLKKTKAQLAVYRQAVLKEAFDSATEDCRMLPIAEILTKTRKGMSTGPFGTMIKKSDHKTSGVPMLGIENIGKGQFIDGNKIYVTPEKAEELKAFTLKAGDIIISRSGTVGEICAVPERAEGALLSTNLMRVSLDNSIIRSDYFIALFQSKGIVLDQIKELCKGSTRDFLNQTILKQIVFPVPSIEKQSEIVSIIEARMSVCDSIEQTVNTALQQAEAMRQSILKDAFEGRL